MQQDITPTNEIKRCPPHRMEMEGQQILKVRDDRIDSVKYWLVVLVIAGHVLMRKEFAESTACAVVWNWIYMFHMPLFIFISGYFSRKKDMKNFLPSIWKLSEPLILFHIIGLLFYVESVSLKTLLIPWHMLWYLLSLIYWRLMLQFIPDKILKHTKIVIISTFCISILAGFLPIDRALSLQRTLSFMPFFFLGYYMRGNNLYLPDKYKPFSIIFLMVIFVILFFFPHRMRYLLHAHPYHNINGVAIRVIAFSLAVLMSIAFMNICYNTPWIAQQGRMSLQYYIYHALLIPSSSSLIIPPFIAIFAAMSIQMTFITALVIITATTLLIAIALKIPYVKMMTNPSLFFEKKS